MAAKNTKIHVTFGGEPVVGATVYVGELLGAAVTTGAGGMCEFDLASGFEGFVMVMIEGVPGIDTALSYMILHEGRTNQIQIPDPS